MLDRVVATRFINPMGNGKTKPLLLECERADGKTVEVVVKCSAGPTEGVKNLAIEAIAAMLAADLGLPVPEPLLVVVDKRLLATCTERDDIRATWLKSLDLAFGTVRVPEGFAVWTRGAVVPDALCMEAAEVFAFDAIIVNSDRRPQNPNCLSSGSELAIFDHELSFTQQGILFWKAPWLEGGFKDYSGENHIFAKPHLKTTPTQMDRFVSAWEQLPDARFDEYRNALPQEWKVDSQFLDFVMSYLRDAKGNIRTIVVNAMGALL